MMQAADITVVIPVYNGAAYLAQAVDSVRRQTRLPCRIVLVDDGSTGPVGTTGDDKPSATTTTEKPSPDKTTTTTADVVTEKTPDQVRVLVLNGGAIAGAAGTMSTSLTEKGYTNQPLGPGQGIPKLGDP